MNGWIEPWSSSMRANHFVVYLILCEGGWYYIRQTRDYHERIQQHLAGEGAEFTKRHKPNAGQC
jgi:predicted GIY-YIG superfamily endonuclease